MFSPDRKRRRSRLKSEVEIQVTPMLDMAFQLLTFFIMTYNPSPIEGQFGLDLLPEKPQTQAAAASSSPTSNELPPDLRTLPTMLRADAAGRLAGLTLGESELDDLEGLRTTLKGIVSDPNLAFDQATIQVDPNLLYTELVQVIDVFLDNNITKISFSETMPGQ